MIVKDTRPLPKHWKSWREDQRERWRQAPALYPQGQQSPNWPIGVNGKPVAITQYGDPYRNDGRPSAEAVATKVATDPEYAAHIHASQVKAGRASGARSRALLETDEKFHEQWVQKSIRAGLASAQKRLDDPEWAAAKDKRQSELAKEMLADPDNAFGTARGGVRCSVNGVEYDSLVEAYTAVHLANRVGVDLQEVRYNGRATTGAFRLPFVWGLPGEEETERWWRPDFLLIDMAGKPGIVEVKSVSSLQKVAEQDEAIGRPGYTLAKFKATPEVVFVNGRRHKAEFDRTVKRGGVEFVRHDQVNPVLV